MMREPLDRHDEDVDRVVAKLTRVAEIAAASRARVLVRLASGRPGGITRPAPLAAAWLWTAVASALVVLAVTIGALTMLYGPRPDVSGERDTAGSAAVSTSAPEALRGLTRLSVTSAPLLAAVHPRPVPGSRIGRPRTPRADMRGDPGQLSRYLAALEQLPPHVLLAARPADTEAPPIEPLGVGEIVIAPVATLVDAPEPDDVSGVDPWRDH